MEKFRQKKLDEINSQEILEQKQRDYQRQEAKR